jgi:hypothetical protein
MMDVINSGLCKKSQRLCKNMHDMVQYTHEKIRGPLQKYWNNTLYRMYYNTAHVLKYVPRGYHEVGKQHFWV